VTEDNSKDLKVAVGVERSLQGSRRRNAVPPPTIEEVHELGTIRLRFRCSRDADHCSMR